ncbi:ABC transporter substrate-binding protein [Butyrivibrio sp. AE3004]|uniref:ABC transporter substrate-binding protein n=1 Tax=Butyrivibrio sp. AE3004 TaxID=1506994 RepID=UPI0004941A64|nr:ABC transporter substrate-binding protein [Butyrivibrio sp. AE3004]
MIKIFKNSIVALISIFFVVFICSCGQNKNIDNSEKLNKDDLIYEFSDFGFTISESSNFTCISNDKDGMYCLKKSNSEGHTNYSLLRLQNDELKYEETLIGSDNTNFDFLVTGDSGSFYVIRTSYPDKIAINNTISDTVFSEAGKTKLVKYSSSGDEIWATSLQETEHAANIKDMVYVKNKGVLIYSQNGFYFYDQLSGKENKLSVKDDDDVHQDRKFFTSHDGKIYVCETDSKWKYVFSEFDFKKMAFTNKRNAPNEIYNSENIFTGYTYDFYYVDDKYVYGFDYGDKDMNKICNFIDSGFYTDNTIMFNETSENNYRLIVDYKVGLPKVFLMTKKNVQEEGKTVITIGTAFTDDYVKKRIIDFNQNSDKYLIRVKEYSEEGYSSYYSVYKAMNEDIESGNSPDIMVLNSYSSIDSYISKGLLEPLDTYIENDKEIINDKYLDNVRELVKRNGKNYVIMPFFSVNTCVGSKNFLNDTKVTLSNYVNLCNKHSIKVPYMMGDIYYDGIDDFYTTSGFDFIDFEKNTCDFTNYNFINLLIYLREIKRLEDSKGPRIDADCYKNDKALLLPVFITSFEDYKVIKDGYFGTDIVFNGYPSIDGGSSYIYPEMMLAISSQSKNKDVAWKFIRYFLLDEYQYSIDWGFPVNKTAFNQLMEKSQNEKFYIDENGKKITTSSKTVIGDKEIYITHLSRSEAEEFKDFICGIDKLRHQDVELIGIISESAKSYFNGEIIAEKASTQIQNRVENYLNNE